MDNHVSHVVNLFLCNIWLVNGLEYLSLFIYFLFLAGNRKKDQFYNVINFLICIMLYSLKEMNYRNLEKKITIFFINEISVLKVSVHLPPQFQKTYLLCLKKLRTLTLY